MISDWSTTLQFLWCLYSLSYLSFIAWLLDPKKFKAVFSFYFHAHKNLTDYTFQLLARIAFLRSFYPHFACLISSRSFRLLLLSIDYISQFVICSCLRSRFHLSFCYFHFLRGFLRQNFSKIAFYLTSCHFNHFHFYLRILPIQH